MSDDEKTYIPKQLEIIKKVEKINKTIDNKTENNQIINNDTGNNNTGNNNIGNNQIGKDKKIKKKYPLNMIFLPDKYNKKTSRWNRNMKKKKSLIKNLEILGVKVYFNNDINEFVKSKVFTFNDNIFPIINTLYIHLFNGAYYCDKQFTSKKIEKEREMIFLLAGKLGVSEIKYKISSSNISINGIDASLNVDKFKLGGTFNKKIINSDEKEYTEKYSNRGAPVYILCKNLEQVEENIKYKLGTINPKVFSYKFYKDNRKLTTFVFKRFNFKMVFLNYTSETEDIYDRTIEIKILLMSSGLGIKINNYMYTTQKICYEMVFFSDQELRLEFDKIIQLDKDPFYQTREIYNSIENKKIAVFSITKYVREFSKTVKYKINNTENEINFGTKLNEWVDNNSDEFLEICHTFTNTYQIEVWLLSVLKLNENEELIESEKKSYNISGINEIKKNNYEMYKKRLLEYDEYKNNDEEEEYDLYYCEMNQSDLNIAKLEKKIEEQNKILKEKKENIKELEKKIILQK